METETQSGEIHTGENNEDPQSKKRTLGFHGHIEHFTVKGFGWPQHTLTRGQSSVGRAALWEADRTETRTTEQPTSELEKARAEEVKTTGDSEVRVASRQGRLICSRTEERRPTHAPAPCADRTSNGEQNWQKLRASGDRNTRKIREPKSTGNWGPAGFGGEDNEWKWAAAKICEAETHAKTGWRKNLRGMISAQRTPNQNQITLIPRSSNKFRAWNEISPVWVPMAWAREKIGSQIKESRNSFS
jgi:hypothetical protein